MTQRCRGHRCKAKGPVGGRFRAHVLGKACKIKAAFEGTVLKGKAGTKGAEVRRQWLNSAEVTGLHGDPQL